MALDGESPASWVRPSARHFRPSCRWFWAPACFSCSFQASPIPAELSTVVDGKPIDRRAGSLLWTHFGISGPVVMDASRFWITTMPPAGHSRAASAISCRARGPNRLSSG